MSPSGPISAGAAEAIAAHLHAIGQPVRIRLLSELAETGDQNVGGLAYALGQSSYNTSQHLNTLHWAGAVTRHRHGREVWYALADGTAIPIYTLAALGRDRRARGERGRCLHDPRASREVSGRPIPSPPMPTPLHARSRGRDRQGAKPGGRCLGRCRDRGRRGMGDALGDRPRAGLRPAGDRAAKLDREALRSDARERGNRARLGRRRGRRRGASL